MSSKTDKTTHILEEVELNSGLPSGTLLSQLSLPKNECDEDNLSLEQLRELAASYLQIVFLETKEKLEAERDQLLSPNNNNLVSLNRES